MFRTILFSYSIKERAMMLKISQSVIKPAQQPNRQQLINIEKNLVQVLQIIRKQSYSAPIDIPGKKENPHKLPVAHISIVALINFLHSTKLEAVMTLTGLDLMIAQVVALFYDSNLRNNPDNLLNHDYALRFITAAKHQENYWPDPIKDFSRPFCNKKRKQWQKEQLQQIALKNDFLEHGLTEWLQNILQENDCSPCEVAEIVGYVQSRKTEGFLSILLQTAKDFIYMNIPVALSFTDIAIYPHFKEHPQSRQALFALIHDIRELIATQYGLSNWCHAWIDSTAADDLVVTSPITKNPKNLTLLSHYSQQSICYVSQLSSSNMSKEQTEKALILAAGTGHTSIGQLLVENFVIPEKKLYRRTPSWLDYAIEHGHADIARLFTENFDLANEQLYHLLEGTIRSESGGSINIIRLFIEKYVLSKDQLNSLLDCAATHGRTNIVLLLFDRGAEIQTRNPDRNALRSATIRGYVNIVQLLLNHNTAPNITDCGLYLSLAWVAKAPTYKLSATKAADVVKVLIKYYLNLYDPQKKHPRGKKFICRAMEIFVNFSRKQISQRIIHLEKEIDGITQRKTMSLFGIPVIVPNKQSARLEKYKNFKSPLCKQINSIMQILKNISKYGCLADKLTAFFVRKKLTPDLLIDSLLPELINRIEIDIAKTKPKNSLQVGTHIAHQALKDILDIVKDALQTLTAEPYKYTVEEVQITELTTTTADTTTTRPTV